jgi:hypothetical protein
MLQLLDIDDFDRNLHSPVARTIAKLSKKFGIYPDSFLLPRVKIHDKNMVASGGFGFIYKGQLGLLNRHTVAVKVMRITQPSHVDKAYKV